MKVEVFYSLPTKEYIMKVEVSFSFAINNLRVGVLYGLFISNLKVKIKYTFDTALSLLK